MRRALPFCCASTAFLLQGGAFPCRPLHQGTAFLLCFHCLPSPKQCLTLQSSASGRCLSVVLPLPSFSKTVPHLAVLFIRYEVVRRTDINPFRSISASDDCLEWAWQRNHSFMAMELGTPALTSVFTALVAKTTAYAFCFHCPRG